MRHRLPQHRLPGSRRQSAVQTLPCAAAENGGAAIGAGSRPHGSAVRRHDPHRDHQQHRKRTAADLRIRTPAIFYEITTTATFSGAITVCIDYTGVGYGNESTLKLYHFENNKWTDVTTSVDTTNKIICGIVTSLSPFVILKPFDVDAPVVMNVHIEKRDCSHGLD